LVLKQKISKESFFYITHDELRVIYLYKKKPFFLLNMRSSSPSFHNRIIVVNGGKLFPSNQGGSVVRFSLTINCHFHLKQRDKVGRGTNNDNNHPKL